MSFHRLMLGASAALALTIAAAPLGAQQPSFVIDKDEATIRGCVRKADIQTPTAAQMLIWSRSDILLAGVAASRPDAPAATRAGGVSERVFYWLDDDEDLTKHVGQLIEVKGKLDDFEVGKIKVERDGEFTAIELDLDGKKEKARVPNVWLHNANATDKDQEFKIIARRIKVGDVKVLGACTER